MSSLKFSVSVYVPQELHSLVEKQFLNVQIIKLSCALLKTMNEATHCHRNVHVLISIHLLEEYRAHKEYLFKQ